MTDRNKPPAEPSAPLERDENGTLVLDRSNHSNVRHSAKNPNWMTPKDILDRARRALGGRIALDPFSCALANETVQAERFFSPENSAYDQEWVAETAWINHPGQQTKKAWAKTCQELLAGRLKQFVWMGFSVEQLCILSEPNEPDEPDEVRWARGLFVPTDFSICLLRKRVAFIDANDPDRRSAPAHANYLLAGGVEPRLFNASFADLGQCIHGALSI